MQNRQKTESFSSRIDKPGKVLEPRGKVLESFQILTVEKNNQDQANIELECFRCFRLWIFPYLCVLFLRFEHRIQFTDTKKMLLQWNKKDSSSVDKGAEQDHLR